MNQYKEQLKTATRSINPTVESRYSTFIPEYFLNHIKSKNSPKSLTNQFYPRLEELNEGGMLDPIGDISKSKSNKIIHRYKNRVLLTPTTVCPIHCRYCFRKNELNENNEIYKGELDKAFEYIADHPEVNEVILTGGDPLILNNKQLENILNELSKIKHVHFVRLHTRTPVILPQRIDDNFINLILKYEQKFLQINTVIHINHLDEMTPLFEEKMKLMIKNGLSILSQSVLLKDVNDTKEELLNLFQALIRLKIRPYYLHHPDKAKGAMHFYLSLDKGRKIYHSLRDELPGWAIPHYIVDIPGGLGKTIAYNPESFHFTGTLIDRKGEQIPYESIL